jgi:Mg2+ and Co2+ transporter CorA
MFDSLVLDARRRKP